MSIRELLPRVNSICQSKQVELKGGGVIITVAVIDDESD